MEKLWIVHGTPKKGKKSWPLVQVRKRFFIGKVGMWGHISMTQDIELFYAPAPSGFCYLVENPSRYQPCLIISLYLTTDRSKRLLTSPTKPTHQSTTTSPTAPNATSRQATLAIAIRSMPKQYLHQSNTRVVVVDKEYVVRDSLSK